MKVLLGVCGGIAAYKAAELTRELGRRGAEVQVALTASAERFVTPLTFASLSGRQVVTSLWQPTTPEATSGEPTAFDIEHIRVAQEADVVVVAPATANFIAKLAHGLADDVLSTACLATKAPILLAPAMNVNMWSHPATQANLETLRTRGVSIISPGSGSLACGMVGEGRLAEPVEIADAVMASVQRTNDLTGETILITAGGTREPIDAVRFIGNRSSGKMGFALAEAAVARGARVVLVTTTQPPSQLVCEQIHVNTASEMEAAVLAQLPRATTVIMAAAVADYTIASPSTAKLKKSAQPMSLDLVPTRDIVRQVALQRLPGTLVIGFAAETERVLEEGRRKLREKGLDAIVANDVSQIDRGFDADQNAGTFLTADTAFELHLSSKRVMADQIFDQMRAIRAVRNPAHSLA